MAHCKSTRTENSQVGQEMIIAQLEFELLSQLPEKDYSGKKYQGQRGVTPSKVL